MQFSTRNRRCSWASRRKGRNLLRVDANSSAVCSRTLHCINFHHCPHKIKKSDSLGRFLSHFGSSILFQESIGRDVFYRCSVSMQEFWSDLNDSFLVFFYEPVFYSMSFYINRCQAMFVNGELLIKCDHQTAYRPSFTFLYFVKAKKVIVTF